MEMTAGRQRNLHEALEIAKSTHGFNPELIAARIDRTETEREVIDLATAAACEMLKDSEKIAISRLPGFGHIVTALRSAAEPAPVSRKSTE